MRGACTTCTATPASGCSMSTAPIGMASSRPGPADARAARSTGPTKLYPRVLRGGSWNMDPPLLRSAARRASNDDEWRRTTPNSPQSPWWFASDESQDVGFRIVRPLEPPPREEWSKYWDADVPAIQEVADHRIDNEGRGERGKSRCRVARGDKRARSISKELQVNRRAGRRKPRSFQSLDGDKTNVTLADRRVRQHRCRAGREAGSGPRAGRADHSPAHAAPRVAHARERATEFQRGSTNSASA